jgi:YHS domain-containing protein
LALNVVGLAIFGALFLLTARRGVSDPTCGMKVDRAKAIRMDFGTETFYFCSDHCLHAFEVNPESGDHAHADGRSAKRTASAGDVHARL